jgi:hypothetical protein
LAFIAKIDITLFLAIFDALSYFGFDTLSHTWTYAENKLRNRDKKNSNLTPSILDLPMAEEFLKK